METPELKMWHEYALSLDDKLEHALRKIEDQQLLLTRAADALEQFLSENAQTVLATPRLRKEWELDNAKIIAQLRKAAE